MSSVMCISSFLECLIYGDKRLTTTTATNIKCQFFLSVSYDAGFLGYVKVFSNQLIIMYK